VTLIAPGLSKVPANGLPRRQDTPGTALRLMVVATGERHCAGVDLCSGALVRAWSAARSDQVLQPYDLVEVTISVDPDVVPDPAEPEAVVVDQPPVLVGRLAGRKAVRLIKPLLHPEGGPLLGFHGAAIPFWERRADHPSVALAEPAGPLMVSIEDGGMWCHFTWANRPQVLACTDRRLAAFLYRAGRSFARLRPGTFLVVALEPPVEGQCHKVIEAVVPRR
jgi:hypothetical protein